MQTDGAVTTGKHSKALRCIFAITIVVLLTSSLGAGMLYNQAAPGVQLSQTTISEKGGNTNIPVNAPVQTESSSTITITYDFSAPELYNDGFDRIRMEDMLETLEPGEPVMPFKTAKVLLPPESTVTSVETVVGEKIDVSGEYKLAPAGEHVPLSEIQEISSDFLVPDEAIYSSAEPYPGMLVEQVSVETFRGYDIAIINLFPVQYIPVKGALYYFESLTLNLEISTVIYESSTRSSSNLNTVTNYRGLDIDRGAVADMVDNPVEVYSYDSALSVPGTRAGPSPKWDMVIITNDEMNGSSGVDYTLQDLADYRNTHGVKTTIVTTENITANPDYWNTSSALFNDTAAQIRNFIIFAYENWGITYVLLAGDGDGKDVGGESGDNIIPARGFKESNDNNVPSDLYYSSLDGNWNNDGDALWGEYPDESDWLAEVYIGRAPVDSAQEVSNFVNKTLHYETTNSSYLEKVLMIGEFLWSNPNTYGGDYMDEMIDGASTHGYTTGGIPQDIFTVDFNISTLYDRDGTWGKSQLINLINNDVHVIHHLGHSNINYNMKMVISNADALNNSEPFIAYSQGCYPGAFDNRGTGSTAYKNYDSIVEHFMMNAKGAVAFVANSRYGYGSRGSTNGASQYFHREFVDALYTENMLDVGRANQDAREDNIGRISSWVMRWCWIESNLFGDPSLKIRDPKPPEHDISVAELDAPSHAEPAVQVKINTTILNRGFNDESSVRVNFSVDGSFVSSQIISFIASLSRENVSFNWTPSVGIYNVSIETQPVAAETILENNERYSVVIAAPDVALTNVVFNKPIYKLEPTDVTVVVSNLGKIDISNQNVSLTDSPDSIYDIIPTVPAETSVNLSLNWTPQFDGSRDLVFFAKYIPKELSLEDNFYNITIDVINRPDIDVSPKGFDLTLPQGIVYNTNLTIYNNGTADLTYDIGDYSVRHYRKIALISDKTELDSINDTLNEMGLTDYTIYNDNVANKYTEKINILKDYGLVIFYSASRAISLNEKLALEEYMTEYNGNLIVTGYDSLGSPTDYNMAYVVRSAKYGDGPWIYKNTVTDASHPIMSGPFIDMAPGSTFQALNNDHDRAFADPARGSKAVATVSGNVKILVTDPVSSSGGKVVYWNGNRYALDWNDEYGDTQLIFKNLLAWLSNDGSTDWLDDSPANGQVNYGYDTNIAVSIDTTKLHSGTYNRRIVIASDDTDEERAVSVPVNLTVTVPAHDIAVINFSSESSVEHNSVEAYSATVKNFGTSTQSGITVQLMLDSTIVDSKTVASLAPGGSSTETFNYAVNSSVSVGTHDFAIKAVPVPFENGTFNNIDGGPVAVYVQALQVLSPLTFDLTGYYDEVISANLTVNNTGTGALDAKFSSYHFELEDEFTTTTLDTTLWPVEINTPVINSAGLNEPSGSYSLNLDGKDDAVESREFDISNATRAYVSFYVEMGGHYWRPRTTTFIYLDYNATNGTWQNAWNKEGEGTTNGYRLGEIDYTFYKVELPADAFHSGFKFRLRVFGLGNGYDDYFVDDLKFEWFGYSDWLTTDIENVLVSSGGASTTVKVLANLTSLSSDVHYGTIYVQGTDPLNPLVSIPVKVTVLGALDHIHMSQSSWSGTADDELTLTATGHDINDREVDFRKSWSTTDPVGTVTGGLYKPGQVGTWTVYCKNMAGTISNSTSVTITEGGLRVIQVSPDNHIMTTDDEQTFTASGFDSDMNPVAVTPTWSVSGGGTINAATGLFEASTVGLWDIIATSGDVSGSVKVVVNTGVLASIELTPDTVELTAGESQQFELSGSDADGNTLPVTIEWSVTGGGDLDDTGLFTAKKTGEWTIYANVSLLSVTGTITVLPGELDRIEVTPSNTILTAGDTLVLTAAGYDAYDNAVTLDNLQWSAPAQAGTFKSPAQFTGTKTGHWELTVTVPTSTVTGKAVVDIVPGALAALTIEPVGIEVSAGTSIQFVASGTDAYQNTIPALSLTWTASGGGEIDSGLYKPRQVGTFTVSAAASGITATASVTVIPGMLSKLEVVPGSTSLASDESLTFSVKGYDFYDNELSADSLEPSWLVDGGGTVSDSGLFHAQWMGTWKLTATSSGKEAYATIIIKPGQAAKLIIEPAEYSMYVGESVTFNVNCYDSYNNPVTTTNIALAWTESGGGTITDTGKFTADTPGSNWEVSVSTGTDTKITASAKVTIKPNDDTDTDGDGIPDLWEDKFGLDPLDPTDAEQDHEGDGADTLTEYQVGTNPRIEDTDGDGLPDGWEMDYQFDPLEAIGVNGGEGDPDSDGYANLVEYTQGSNPRNGRDPAPDSSIGAKSDSSDKSKGLSGIALAGILIVIIIAVLILTMLLKRTGRLPKFGKSSSPDDSPEPGSPYDLINQTTPFIPQQQLPLPQAPMQPQQPPQWPMQPPQQQLPAPVAPMAGAPAPMDRMQEINEQTTKAINNSLDDQYNQL